MDADDRALLAATVDQALASCHGADADTVLVELGWLDLLVAEPVEAVAVVFTALGRENARSRCLADVIASALGAAPGTGVVLPAYGGSRPPGLRTDAGMAVDGLLLAPTAGPLLVACDDGSVVEIDPGGLTIREVEGIDPTLGLAMVTGEARVLTEVGPAPWEAAVDAARLALAHELAGAARAMIGLARDHAVGRVQFGRPIASFQAVRHRLAEALIAVEAADAALEAAHAEPSPIATTLAKVLAGRAAATAAAHGQQVLAGIGFTRDHEFHRYLFRTTALDGLFCSTSALTHELGALVLRGRTVPRVIDL